MGTKLTLNPDAGRRQRFCDGVGLCGDKGTIYLQGDVIDVDDEHLDHLLGMKASRFGNSMPLFVRVTKAGKATKKRAAPKQVDDQPDDQPDGEPAENPTE